MLSSIKNDLLYLLNIIEYIEKINLYAKDSKDSEEFYNMNDQLNFNACLNLMANIGENIAKTSDELREKYSSIKWKEIKGFRNRIVHDYVNVDTFMVFDIIRKDLNILKTGIIEIISKEISCKNFDIEELKVAKDSFYYRHIKFEDLEK